MHEDEEYTENETEQSCFDIMISSLVEGVMYDEEMKLDEDDKSYIIDEILNVLEDHLDDEGLDMLNEAFEKFQNEYELQVKTEDILNSFDWHKSNDEE